MIGLALRTLIRLLYRPLVLATLAILLAAGWARAEVELPVTSDLLSIEVHAPQAQRWQQGQYEVWLLTGGVKLAQGSVQTQSQEAVLWVDRAAENSDNASKIIAYLEGDVTVDYGRDGNRNHHSGRTAQTVRDRTWFGRFHTIGDIKFNVPRVSNEPMVLSAVYQRGSAERRPIRDSAVQPAQFSNVLNPFAAPEGITAPPGQPLGGVRRVQVFPRSTTPVQARWFPIPQRNERVAVIESGVQVQVDGPDVVGKVDLEADRIVIWTSENALPDLSGQKSLQDKSVPLEFYLEGNIVFRQGDRIIYADRMYYNVQSEYGVVLNAEVLTPVPEYQGLLRLKADVLQQVDSQNFQAYGAAITSSRMGVPRYWLQSQQVTFQDNQRTAIDPITGQPAVDPNSGEPIVDHNMLATSNNNFLYFGGYPIFYWPRMATDLTEPNYYIQRVKIANDSVFGFQIYTDLDAYQLLGVRNKPTGTKWNISTDLLSERGAAFGTNFRYNRDNFFGVPGPVEGFIDAWGLHDSGLDNLGADRRALVPETRQRGRILGRHRQQLGDGWQFTGELGLISDYNFLEEYFENEWDTYKDETTGIELKRYADTMSYGILADVRVNDFFTQTNWLPRADHHWLGQDIFEVLTYNAHSNIGYGKLEVVTPPLDDGDLAKFDPLAWEFEREGVRAATRQEIDYPFALGPVKVVPYALGEVAHWGEDIAGDDLTRLYGQAGVRASMPMWALNRDVSSELFNLNGLAHKITFDAELSYADANQDLDQLPLYDPLDDNSIQHFRRRFYFNTFNGVKGGNVALPFDERYYALRTGIQGNVTSPSTEIADDLTLAKFGVRQRWQTKRGLPGRERIIDWITLDVQATLFPDAARDNFNEDIGLIDYDFSWHIGDRLTILSDGYADLFEDGLQTVSVGGLSSRPELGSLYVGYRQIQGPFKSSIVNAFVNYRLSEKWVLTAGSSFDLEDAGNIGQTVSVTRIGESLLVRMGFNYDESRDNFNFQFELQPRFLPTSALGRVGGVQIPPAGALGLE